MAGVDVSLCVPNLLYPKAPAPPLSIECAESITPAVLEYLDKPPEEKLNKIIRNLTLRHNPQNPEELFVLIARSVFPSDKKVSFKGKEYFGLPKNMGGLEISYNDNVNYPPRSKEGGVSTDLLLSGTASAFCFEYYNVLKDLYSAAGYQAAVFYESGLGLPHTNILVKFPSGLTFKIDISNLVNHGVFIKEYKGPFPDSGSNDYQTFAIANYNNGTSKFAQGNYEGAVGSFLIAALMDPKNVYFLEGLSAGLIQRGERFDTEAAIKILNRAISLNPSSLYSWKNLAHAYAQAGKYNESINACNKVLGSPNSPYYLSALFIKGYSLYKKGATDEAYAIFNLIKKTHPDYPYIDPYFNTATAAKISSDQCYVNN